jgi:hypothetical protein
VGKHLCFITEYMVMKRICGTMQGYLWNTWHLGGTRHYHKGQHRTPSYSYRVWNYAWGEDVP